MASYNLLWGALKDQIISNRFWHFPLTVCFFALVGYRQSMEKETTSFEKILKGYLGFLEGTGKSRLTISSYRGDLEVFRKFIVGEGINFQSLSRDDFDRYHHFLLKRGLKTNTRRRKLITARSLCRYALSRNKIDLSPAQFIKPPDRLERLPWVPEAVEYEDFLAAFPVKTPIGKRNRLLAEMLGESALSISELCSLSWADIESHCLNVPGKRSRRLELSPMLRQRLEEWRVENSGKFLFPGYNRHGMATERMSPRGVEIMFRVIAERAGYPELKPKTLRHYAILRWLKETVRDVEIQRRLGVSSGYSLHAYRKYLKQSSIKQ